MKKTEIGIRFVKVGNPDIVRYFTIESIKYYNPEREGWVRDEVDNHPPPEDVINYMENRTMDEPEPQVKDYSTMATRKIEAIINDLTKDDLLNIIETDQRVTARRMAEKEIQKRG